MEFLGWKERSWGEYDQNSLYEILKKSVKILTENKNAKDSIITSYLNYINLCTGIEEWKFRDYRNNPWWWGSVVSTAGRVVMGNHGCCELLGHKDYREVTEPVDKSANTGLEQVADLAVRTFALQIRGLEREEGNLEQASKWLHMCPLTHLHTHAYTQNHVYAHMKRIK